MTPVRQTRRTQEERRAATRTKLLEATVQSLREGGYAATTTRRVSELAGVSQGAMTYHFPHRADLVAAAMEHLAEQRLSAARASASAMPAEPGERAAALLDLLWRDFSGDVFSIFVKLWVVAADDPELHRRLVPVERALARTIASTARAMEGLPDLPDRDARLQLVLAALRGLALSRSFEPGAPKGDGAWKAVRPLLERIALGD